MKMKFSERIGLFKPKTLIPRDKMPKDLRNTLWSLICVEVLERKSNQPSNNDKFSELSTFFRLIWLDVLKVPTDNLEIFDGRLEITNAYKNLREWFFEAEWYQVYEFLEFCAVTNDNFALVCNTYLKREFAAFRFVDKHLVEIDSEEEIKEIEKAINQKSRYYPVKEHLKTSLKLITDKRNPDYRNSIKESISAVESLCKIIVGDNKTTLGQALKQLEKEHNIPKSLKSGFSSIYGYTSDNGGIRHSLLNDDIKIEIEEAKFMLVACSAFINYLISKV